MRGIVTKFWNGYKEYIAVVVLLTLSLTLISQDKKPGISRVKTLAFGGFAIFNAVASQIVEPFQVPFEIKQLRENNAKLMLQVNHLREYGIQNEELKKMLALKDSSSFPLIAARVVSKFVSASQGNFTIGAGENEGIKIGMPVISYQGLVGLVIMVSPDFSIVRTLKNSEMKFAIKNQRSRFDGVLGWNGKELVIKNVPKTYDMQVGDRIVTSDFSSKFPPSIPVGIVSGGMNDKTGIFNNISVKPFVDFVAIDNVFIIAQVPSVQKNNLELNLLKK